MILTFQDLLDHALAYGGDDNSVNGSSKCRRAVHNAYRVIATRHQWAYLWALGRVNTHGVYSTGTVAFDLTGGAFERLLTLTTGTWPSWAADGYVVIDNVPYEVDERKSDSTLTLVEATSPTEDIAADTTYSLQQDAYALPADFIAADEVIINEVGVVMEYVHPRSWSSARRSNAGPGQPLHYSFIGDTDRVGSLKIVLHPPPDAVYAMDFLYRRRFRPLVFEKVEDGTVSVGAAGTTVTGVTTAFKSAMIGSVIRFGPDNQTSPTGDGGEQPAVHEAKITAVASTTSLTIDEGPAAALDGVKYVITDPADVDPNVMADYLLREIESQFRIVARVKPLADENRHYELALQRAMEADNRNSSRMAILRSQSRRSGYVHYPISFPGG